MKIIQVIVGNITFFNFTEEELLLFKYDTEEKALVHEVQEVKYFNTKQEAYNYADNTVYDSWLIPLDFKGEIVFKDYKN